MPTNKQPLDLVLINMSNFWEWQKGVSNRNYHILRELEKNPNINRIVCLDYPPLTWKRAARNLKESILTPLDNGTVIQRDLFSRTTKISDRLYVHGSLRSVRSPESYFRHFKSALSKLGITEFVLWSFFPPLTEAAMSTLQPKFTIFDAVDNWAEHSSYAGMKERLKKSYEYIKNNVDVIFTVADDLQNLFDHQKNVYWIPNGVDLKHYQKPWRLVNRDISDLPKPIIGYIGVIQNRVDLELIKYLAKENPHYSLVLCGPVWYRDDFKALEEYKNIHLLGFKHYEEAPMYINFFDVGIIPHKKDNFISSTNPMKMYEYLACGKPVVASESAGAEMFQGEALIAENYEDFNLKIRQALKSTSEEDKQRRQKLIEKHSWSKAVQQMLEIIYHKMNY